MPIFRETPQMIAFFESRAGASLPGGEYAQALVQEMAGLSGCQTSTGVPCSATRAPSG